MSVLGQAWYVPVEKDNMNRNKVWLYPFLAQKEGEDGGQSTPRLVWCKAEAPRQRPGKEESGPLTAGQSTRIWLRTGSTYGTLVKFDLNPLSINGFRMVKLNLLHIKGRCWLILTYDHHPTVFGDGNHPGDRYSLSSGREQPGTQENCSINVNHNLPVGWNSSRRCHSSLRAGKPLTWRRSPANPIERTLKYGARRKSLGTYS